jgi:hypothetical protein
MKRSVGVTVIAILSLLGSALTFVMGILMLAVMVLAPVPRANQFPGSPILFKVFFIAISLMYMLPAVWGILSGVGLWRLKNWARISTIVFSVLLILMGGFAGLVSFVVPFPATPSNAANPQVIFVVRMAMGIFWLTQLGIGIWWLVFLNRSKVKEQFGQAAQVVAAPTALQPAYPAQSVSVSAVGPGVAKRPLSITIIAWFMLAGCLFLPLGLVMRGPVILFTKILMGWPAVWVYLAFTAAQLGIGLGLLRVKPAARMAAIIYFVFAFVNSAVFYFAPGGHARMLGLLESQQSMFPWMRLFQSQAEFHFDFGPFLIMGAVLGLVVISVPLYFLVTRKVPFENAAAALESAAGQAG